MEEIKQQQIDRAREAQEAKEREQRKIEESKKRGANRPMNTYNDSTKRQRTEVATIISPPMEKDPFLDLADNTNVAIIVPYRDLHPEQNHKDCDGAQIIGHLKLH